MKTLSPKTRVRLIMRDGKKVRAHRWIMEQHLGRKLTANEQVHHINENPLDNRLENLTVLSPKEHMSLHKQVYPDKKICVVCAGPFQPSPRKRKRQKCCGPSCAMQMRIAGRQEQNARKSRKRSAK